MGQAEGLVRLWGDDFRESGVIKSDDAMIPDTTFQLTTSLKENFFIFG